MPPNFLIFITDQHRADHLGCYGNSIVRTPNIDALAQDGVRFDRAYVAAPVCMPNRGSIMTSRMPSVHGARSNGVPLPLESVTFADLLGESGYRTALVGKSHIQNMEDLPPVLKPAPPVPGTQPAGSWPESRRGDIDSAAYGQELHSAWRDPAHRIQTPYYGFQDVILCNGHADECFGDWSRWLEQAHPELAQRRGREHGVRDPAISAPQAWRTPLDEFTYPTHYIAEQSSRWIEDHVQNRPDQPFALMCSFPDPHHPWSPPGRYWDMYRPEDMPLPASGDPDVAQPRHVQWLMDERSSGAAKLNSPRLFAATARELQEMIALTFGMITNIDDRIGMVMETLKKCGVDQNTVVIFTADHGDLMGDHGIVLKGPLHYQGLVRVPFIWRDPAAASEAPAARRDDLVSSIDLAASILARAGISAPNGAQGKALFDPVGAGLPSGRGAVLIEENQQRAYMGFENPVRARTLVTARHRLTVFQEGDWGELYDLLEDPLELTNLWDEPEAAGTRSTLLHRLARALIEHAETSPNPTRIA